MTGVVLLVLRVFLALSLYAFLGWALYTLWRELHSEADLLTMHQAPSIALDSPDGKLAFRFDKPEVSIGRDPSSDCPIEDMTVSTQHARLSYHHNQWWIEDLGSTNGTYLNQEVVSTPLVLTVGDQIRCGQVVLNISISE